MKVAKGRWGGWEIDTDRAVISHPDFRYDIPLDQTLSGAAVANWAFQIAGKTWGTEEIVGGLVKALYDFWGGSAQAVLAPGGQNREADFTMLNVRLEEVQRDWLALS